VIYALYFFQFSRKFQSVVAITSGFWLANLVNLLIPSLSLVISCSALSSGDLVE